MKVAIVGCGAVGSYYGAMLSRAGQEVHFLLRSDFEAVRCNGVAIHSPNGDFVVHPHAAQSPEQIGPSDLVLIALKTTANAEFVRLLPPLVGSHTAVVTLQNGLGSEEQLAQFLPANQILGGLCFVCLNRIAPGVIRHLDHGLIMLGEFQRPPQPRTQEFAQLFRDAGVPCQVTDNLARAHWEKLVWNIPFNGLGVASAAGYEAMTLPGFKLQVSSHPGDCLTTDKLLADGLWEDLVRDLMHEVIAIASALGHPIEHTVANKMIERTRTMGAYQASTLLDFEMGRPLELESLFLEPLRQAQRVGVTAPRLARLCAVLEQLDARRAPFVN